MRERDVRARLIANGLDGRAGVANNDVGELGRYFHRGGFRDPAAAIASTNTTAPIRLLHIRIRIRIDTPTLTLTRTSINPANAIHMRVPACTATCALAFEILSAHIRVGPGLGKRGAESDVWN